MTARPGGAGASSATAAPAALRALLAGIVDYAGLFPPAALDMPAAGANYAAYRAGADRWALGRFVVPASRLGEFEREAAPRLPKTADTAAWRLSALLGAPTDDDLAAVRDFNRRHADPRAGHAVVDTLEAKASTPDEVARLAGRTGGDFELYVEIPVAAEPAPLLEAIRDAGARAKVRTGGVTADAFPPAAQLARFVAACARTCVPFKATAGLHHPLRASYRLTYAADSASATMYGFLNVFLAAALLRAGMPEGELPALLEESRPDAFHFDAGEARWRDWRANRDILAETRAGCAIAFGSCSFEEPIGELRKMGLL